MSSLRQVKQTFGLLTSGGLLLNLAAKILIIIELYKSFDAFSVVCCGFVRSFVALLFGRL